MPHWDWTFRPGDIAALVLPLGLWIRGMVKNWLRNSSARFDNIEDAIDDVLTALSSHGYSHVWDARTRFRQRRREIKSGEHKVNGRADG